MKKRIPFDEMIPFRYSVIYGFLDGTTDDTVRSLFYDSPLPEDDGMLYDFDGIVALYMKDDFFSGYRDKPVQLVRDHVGKTIAPYTCPTWNNYPEEKGDE